MFKKCRVCGHRKNIKMFNNDKKNPDGKSYRCKECKKFTTAEYYKKNRLNIIEKAAEYYNQNREYCLNYRKKWRIKNKAKHSTWVERWRQNNLHKKYAHGVLERAVAKGIVLRGVCEICGKDKVDGHHDNYSKPLSVRWLCRKHHKEYHLSNTL